jgi:farnesyl-diphosphate farnesyltransferase
LFITMGALSLILKHPGDIIPLYRVKCMADQAKKLPKEPNLRFCYHMLNLVSRSFAIVIQQLPHELQDAVCVFYLVLRALDTVEDDMSIPDTPKCKKLEIFWKKIYDPKYTYPCGEKHYKVLMDEYPKVTAVFLSLKKEYQEVIADITKRMGEGMSNFIKREVVTLEDWDEYCHYVAGLVGIGLSNLWANSMLEDKRFADTEELSNAMGLFLQKTNIIRDYLEDIMEEPAPRMFWPKCIWSKHGKTLDAFAKPENRAAAVSCMNELITNGLAHATDSIEYLTRLKNVDVFRFCGIPQVMAIATMAECYDNGKVFEGVGQDQARAQREDHAAVRGQVRRRRHVQEVRAGHPGQGTCGGPEREENHQGSRRDRQELRRDPRRGFRRVSQKARARLEPPRGESSSCCSAWSTRSTRSACTACASPSRGCPCRTVGSYGRITWRKGRRRWR